MKRTIISLFSMILFLSSMGQIPLTVAPSGGNKKAIVGERIGLTDVTIHYDRPAVKGREGRVWGQLVPVGFTDPGFGRSKSAPWRAGANENTIFEFSTDVKIEGQHLPAGKYGFFIAYDPNESILIFSKNHTSWGHFFYDDKEDALRVKVKPQPIDRSVEWMKYEFMNETENTATVSLQWEQLSIPFRIEVDYIKEQIESFRRELRTEKGFLWQSWDQAAQWCVQRKTNLNEALLWADTATGPLFGGERSFQARSTKAQILQSLGRGKEAAEVMDNAIPLGTMNEVHQYARQLVGLKLNKMAFDVFKKNHDKYPGQFTTLVGMMRGHSAMGEYSKALEFGQKALPLAADQQNRNNVETMIQKLKEGKDIN